MTLRCDDSSPDDPGMTCSLLPGHVTMHEAYESHDTENGRDLADWPNVTDLADCARAAAAGALTLLGGRDLSRLPEGMAADLRLAVGALERVAAQESPEPAPRDMRTLRGFAAELQRWVDEDGLGDCSVVLTADDFADSDGTGEFIALDQHVGPNAEYDVPEA